MGLIRKSGVFLTAAVLASAQLLAIGAATPVVAADPIRVDVCITDSNGNALVPGTTWYKIGSSSFFFSNTVEGTTNCKYMDFPGTTTDLEIWTTFNNTASARLTQDITQDPVFDFQTHKLTLALKSADGESLAGGTARYGINAAFGTWNFPGGATDTAGTTSAEFFPGTYSVEMRYESTTDVKSSVVMPAANETLTWKTATVTLAWPNQISYGGPTGSLRFFNKPTMDLLAGTYTFHFRDPNGFVKDLTWSAGEYFSFDPTDDQAPTANPTQDPAKNSAGWNNTDVTVDWNWTDNAGGSGIDNDNCKKHTTVTDEGVSNLTASCSDLAGNTGQASRTIKIDGTPPTVSLVGGPADGGSYVFGSVPAAPTCEASDTGSGLDGVCEVIDYSASVGEHTVKARAFDQAGNKGTDTATYTVTAWTLEGFFKPINMDGVLNRVKAGSTVPLKFRVFAGSTELTDPAVVESLQAQRRDCEAIDDDTADIPDELTETGDTSLRYADGQFIYNWKTAKAKAGQCFAVKVSTDDGSSIKAFFELK